MQKLFFSHEKICDPQILMAIGRAHKKRGCRPLVTRNLFSYLRHLFEYIGTQFPPPSSLLYGKMGSITLFFFKWEY
jgi:hypothetical protein